MILLIKRPFSSIKRAAIRIASSLGWRRRTRAENDESRKQRFWGHAVEWGVQYYVGGRFAVFAAFTPTCGNQCHHAVELLLKACLAYTDSWAEIQRYKRTYGHDLRRLWREFKRRDPNPALAAYDTVIKALNKFEDIRYPDPFIERGALLNIEMVEVQPGQESRVVRGAAVPTYTLQLPKLDRLVRLLFEAAHYNVALAAYWFQRPAAGEYFWRDNTAPFAQRPG